MNAIRLSTTIPLTIIVVLLAGCGTSTEPRAISGLVTLDDRPLESGYITFEPKGGQPTQAGGPIVAGKYEARSKGNVAPGPYAVAIVVGGPSPPEGVTPGTPEYEAAASKLPGERIPKKYNVSTTLVAEVTADGENVFNFDLASK